MFSKVFLAMTQQEMSNFPPQRLAYMALHFSSHSHGLSNAPKALPQGSLLLLDDSMPVQGHSPEMVVSQLKDLAERFSPKAILLDFQRKKTEESAAMAKAIADAVPCTAVTEAYRELPCPVILPPPPVNMNLQTYLAPWEKRGVYLEIAPEAVQFTVTLEGCCQRFLPLGNALPFTDTHLHCHYGVQVSDGCAVFSLERTREDLAALVQEADVLGLVGLYQQLG